MIVNTKEEKTAEQVGEIENNNVSIDTSNIDFIVTLLSTSLYSKPIESFIRETVSNAWDSHVEAGVDDPVILELGIDTEGRKFCRIQDFGVGLSPERFDKVYKNIGSSTKRDSNEQIGGFGIGRFSALAYSEVVHITSVHGGQKYLYIMYKDGNSISIDMLHQQDTDERNGLEVKVEIQTGDYRNFIKAIKSQLVYFENLYVIDNSKTEEEKENSEDIQKQYNSFSIKKYDNFWVNTLDSSKEVSLVLGKVRYPVRLLSLDENYPARVHSYPISLKFEIGDLEVTPNREEILYSTQNKKTIEDRLNLAVEEIEELILKEKSKDYKKYSEYIEAIKDTQYLTLLKVQDREIKLKLSDSKKNITLNGESFNAQNFLKMHTRTMGCGSVLPAEYKLQHDQIKYVNRYLSIGHIKNNFEDMFIADLSDVKNITKRYIRETFSNGSYFMKLSRPVKFYIKNYINFLKTDNNHSYRNKDDYFFDFKAFKVICRYMLSNLKHLKSFNDSKVPLKWIADTKAADKIKRGNIKKQGFDWKQNINLHTLYIGRTGTITNSSSYGMKNLHKKFKKLTIYAEKNNEKIRFLHKYLKEPVLPHLVEIAPTKVKLLKEVNNFVKIEDFMNGNYKLIRNIATVEFLKREIPFLEDLAKINNIGEISPRLAEAVSKLNEFRLKYESSIRYPSEQEEKFVDEIYNLSVEKNYFNDSIKAIFIEHKKELLNARILATLSKSGHFSSNTIPEDRINLTVDYLLARKLIRPSLEAVVKMKKETIFNIKTEENESN